MAIAGAILAGGKSTRMGGGHKFLRELGGRTLFDRVRGRLGPQVDFLLTSCAPRATLYDLGAVTIEDQIADAGHAVGGWMKAVFGGEAFFATVPADTPFIPLDLVENLMGELTRSDYRVAVATCFGDEHYGVALWSCAVSTDLTVWLHSGQRRSIKDFIRSQPHVLVPFDRSPDPFFNINTVADLELSRGLIEGSSM